MGMKQLLHDESILPLGAVERQVNSEASQEGWEIAPIWPILGHVGA